jgi:RNA polymerase sigma factor (sigma-70 family)
MVVHPPRKAVLSRASDRRLAALAAAGEESAFEAIFERHHRGLLSFCRHLLGSPEEAEDVLQHTFAAAFRQLVEREPPDHLRAWLYTTARNRCLDVLRARREQPTDPAPVSTAGLSEEVERRNDLRELVDDIGKLPEDQRAALVMSEIEELGHAEVAEVLGCPRDKVRALVYQARSSLAAWREARALPCREVRQELAVARGGALRRRHLRRHLNLCRECAAFREDMDRQRRGLALVLPVLPAIGLTERVMEAAWGAASAGGSAAAGGAAVGGGGAASGGGAAGGGGLAGLLGATAIKIGAAALVLGGGAATFVGVSDRGAGEPVELGEPASSAALTSQRSIAREFREVAARRDRERDRASKRRRERSATASPDSTEPAQPEEEAAAAPVEPNPTPQAPTPQAPTPQAPTPDAPTLETPSVSPPDVEAELEVEVDPPEALP